MHNVLWTCKQTKHCRYIKTQARKGPSATANFFLLSSHVQPHSRLWTHSCASFSSQLCVLLLSAFPASLSCPPQCRHLWALQSKFQTLSPTTLGNPRVFRPLEAQKHQEKHTKVIMQTCRFFCNAQKTNSSFLEGNVITNINILTLKALSHLPVSFWLSFCWSVGWVIVLIRLSGKQVSNFPQTNT